jgi:hypothetical protein
VDLTQCPRGKGVGDSCVTGCETQSARFVETVCVKHFGLNESARARQQQQQGAPCRASSTLAAGSGHGFTRSRGGHTCVASACVQQNPLRGRQVVQHKLAWRANNLQPMAASTGPSVGPSATHRLRNHTEDASAGASAADAGVGSGMTVPHQMRQYTRVEKIGQGTYGEVYKATVIDEHTGEGASLSPPSKSTHDCLRMSHFTLSIALMICMRTYCSHHRGFNACS